MSWTPRQSAVFEDVFCDNVLTLVTRDMKPALDYFYPEEGYPDFVERSLGEQVGLEFPLLVIAPKDNAIDESDDSSQLIEVCGIDLFIGVTSDGPISVMRTVMRYVRALDAVLRTEAALGKTGLYYQNIDVTKAMGLVVDVLHTYGPQGQDRNRPDLYFRPAILRLTISMAETL